MGKKLSEHIDDAISYLMGPIDFQPPRNELECEIDGYDFTPTPKCNATSTEEQEFDSMAAKITQPIQPIQ